MTDTTVKPASTFPKAGGTAYIIFRQVEDHWAIFTGATATSPEKAITKALETEAERGREQEPGTYVAVPKRSWRPVTVTVETKTTIRLD